MFGQSAVVVSSRYLPGQNDLAKRVSYAWASLSRACDQHAYQLAPTAGELVSCIETVEQLVAAAPWTV